MNVATNKEPIAKINKFKGLWARGTYETCPPDHLTDCFNCSFPANTQLTVRERFTIQNIIAGREIISFAIATVANGAALLTLNYNGDFWDETHAVKLGTVGGADDFSVLNIFGRTYITFKKGGRALTGQAVYVYDGVTFRGTGWNPPGTGPTLSQPNPGHVDVGQHTIAVSFQSPTGYLSKPSPIAAISSDGKHSISIANIPVGPAGTVARWLLISRANESQLFFMPDGVIGNNVTTTYEYNGFDTDLIDSADYLNDILTSVPAGAALKFYKGRMVVIGQYGSPDNILVSRQQDPETFSLVDNVVKLPANYGISTSCGGLVIRQTLYVTKPNATWAVQDNGGEPSTWGVDSIDSGIGAYDNGLSVYASDMSAQDVLDSSLVCSKRGLLYFNGQYGDLPLTYKIESIWNLLDENYFYNVQIAHDVWNKRVYIAVPLDPPVTQGYPMTRSMSGACNVILMMDYQDGLNPAAVQWSVWTAPNTPYRKIAVENFTLNYTGNTMIYQLATCSGGTNIWKLNPPILQLPQLPDDLGAGSFWPINQYIATANVGGDQGVHTFTMLDLCIGGYGTISLRVFDKFRSSWKDYKGFKLDMYGNVDLQRLINFTHEKMQLMIMADQTNPGGLSGYFTLDYINVFGFKAWNMRPAVQQSE